MLEISDVSMRCTIKRIAAKSDHVQFCYETGSTGCGLSEYCQCGDRLDHERQRPGCDHVSACPGAAMTRILSNLVQLLWAG